MSELVVIFHTPSEIEANVIRGLLETHGIDCAVLSDNSRTAFPLALNDQDEICADDVDAIEPRVDVVTRDRPERRRQPEPRRQWRSDEHDAAGTVERHRPFPRLRIGADRGPQDVQRHDAREDERAPERGKGRRTTDLHVEPRRR